MEKEARDLEDESIAYALWERGVRILRTPETPRRLLDVSHAELALLLLRHPSARYRLCIPLLLLACSDRANEIRGASTGLRPPEQGLFRALFTLAVCLQRRWWTRLRISFPTMSRIEDAFSAELALPSPDLMHARLCLAAMDPELVASCSRLFRVFLEEKEIGLRVTETAAGRG